MASRKSLTRQWPVECWAADAGRLSSTCHFSIDSQLLESMGFCEVCQVLQVSSCMLGIGLVVVDHLLARCQSQELHIVYMQINFLHPMRTPIRIQVIRHLLFLLWTIVEAMRDIAVKQREKSFYYCIHLIMLSRCICGKTCTNPLGAQALIDFAHQELRLIFLCGVLSEVCWVPLFALNFELVDLLGKRGFDWLEDLWKDEVFRKNHHAIMLASFVGLHLPSCIC